MSRPVSTLVLGLLATGFVGSTLLAADHPQLKAYPAAKEGMERFVIVLPDKTRKEEGAFKVEIVVGKTVLGDGVNRMFLADKLEEKVVKGWGYTYFEVVGSGNVGSTLIGVPPGTPKKPVFVSAQPKLVRYNSRLPVVVYAPKGYTVKYNIWTRGEKVKTAEPG